MKPEVEKLVRKALELNERDRAEVAARLASSVEDDEEPTARSRPRPQNPRESKRFETQVFDLGPCRLENLDDIAQVLAIAEGEDFK